MRPSGIVLQSLLARLRARREQAKLQGQLFKDDRIFKEVIRSKLDGRFETNQFVNFTRCGEEQIFRTCKCCSAVEKFSYRCNLKWCPVCAWRMVKKRQQLLQIWASKIKVPKHLVLTQKNFPILTKRKLKEHTRALARFRRSVCFKEVRGGSVSVEITNEGNGWHLHSHWLLDVDWLDMGEVARTWGNLVGQEFAIVKVKAVAGQDYTHEVTKYVCEGSELASWEPEHILEFVTAIKGRRFFFTFGSLRGFSAQVREELEFLKPEREPCECGATDFLYEDETQAVLNEVRKMEKKKYRR